MKSKKLEEATMLALQGKLNESKKVIDGKTWDELYNEAETYNKNAIKALDQARYEMEELLKADGIDIENVESVEDEIENYLKTHKVRFADNGCILDESKKVTESISFDNIMDYRELIDSDNGDLVDTFFFDHKLTEEEDKAIIEAINKAKSDVEDYDNYTIMEYINQIVPIKQSLSGIYADLGPSSKKQIKY